MSARRTLRLLGPALALCVAFLLVRQITGDWRSLPSDALAAFHFDPAPLVVAWLVQTAGWLLVVATWARILAGLGHRLPFVRHLQLYTYSSLAYVLPGSVWVPAGRVAMYRRAGVDALDASAAIVVEWLLLGLAGLALYGFAAPFSQAIPPRLGAVAPRHRAGINAIAAPRFLPTYAAGGRPLRSTGRRATLTLAPPISSAVSCASLSY